MKSKQGDARMYSRKVARNQAGKYARKNVFELQTFMNEKLQGSTQKTVQKQQEDLCKNVCKQNARMKRSKELGHTFCQKSIKELLMKIYNKGCKETGRKLSNEGCNQLEREAYDTLVRNVARKYAKIFLQISLQKSTKRLFQTVWKK